VFVEELKMQCSARGDDRIVCVKGELSDQTRRFGKSGEMKEKDQQEAMHSRDYYNRAGSDALYGEMNEGLAFAGRRGMRNC